MEDPHSAGYLTAAAPPVQVKNSNTTLSMTCDWGRMEPWRKEADMDIEKTLMERLVRDGTSEKVG